MTEDRSLDEFVDARSADTGDGDADADAEDRDVDAEEGGPNPEKGDPGAEDGADAEDPDPRPSEGPAIDPAAVEPTAATSAWTTAGAACERCGDPADRRWDDDGEFVCSDCKRW